MIASLFMIFWVVAFVVMPLVLIACVIALVFSKPFRLKRLLRLVMAVSVIHFFITAVAMWIFRDGLLGPPSSGKEAFVLFLKPMSVYIILILFSVIISSVSYRIKSRRNLMREESNSD